MTVFLTKWSASSKIYHVLSAHFHVKNMEYPSIVSREKIAKNFAYLG